MTVSSLSGGAAAALIQGTSALSRNTDAAVAVLRTVKQQTAAEGAALVSLIQQAGAAPGTGQNLDVWA
jgi:hypothetical protein